MKKRDLISGCVDVIGDNVKRILDGCVDVTMDSFLPELYLHIGNNIIIQDPSQMEQYKIFPISDIIKDTLIGQEIVVPNVKVTFLRDYVVQEKNEYQYSANKVVVDYCITNSNGEYNVFLEPGIYTIKIEGGIYNKLFLNQQIDSGLKNEYYFNINNSLIKSKYEDIIEFSGTDKKTIYGTIINELNRPVENAEIIITLNNEVVSYVKTDKDGKYFFTLDNGIYDIRIRGPKYPVKIIKNYYFENGKGFIKPLIEQYGILSNANWIITY